MALIPLFKALLACKSVTPNEAGTFALIRELLDDFEAVRYDDKGVQNLFLYKRFSEGPHLCFAGHVDVVPAGEGWEHDPFEPVEKEGLIIARGTQDMKSGVAAFVQAVRDAKDFKGTLSILLTSDEEGPAKHGTLSVLKALKKEHFLPDFAVVAEPTCEHVMGDAIKVGRRGSINATLTIKGKQGHAAYPDTVLNPVNLLAPKLSKLAGHLLDSGDDYFEPSQIVVTDIRGGMQVSNVTPNDVAIMFNVRNNTQSTLESIKSYIQKLFADVDYDLKIEQSSKSFVTNSQSPIVKALSQSIEHVCGIKAKHSTAGGTSDARYLAEYGIDVVEFGVKNDKIHKVNEATSINEVEKLYASFLHLIENFTLKG